MYPELKDDEVITLDEIIDKAKKTEGKHFASIKNYEHQLRINEKLMDLRNPNIPEDALVDIHSMIDNPRKVLESKEFMKMYEEDGLGGAISNLQNWIFTNFHNLSKYK